MVDWCPHCGGEIRGSEDRIARWRTDCTTDEDLVIVRDRVPPATAASLCGVSMKWLSRHRERGTGPRWASIPVAGSRISYELADLVAFYEAHVHGERWE